MIKNLTCKRSTSGLGNANVWITLDVVGMQTTPQRQLTVDYQVRVEAVTSPANAYQQFTSFGVVIDDVTLMSTTERFVVNATTGENKVFTGQVVLPYPTDSDTMPLDIVINAKDAAVSYTREVPGVQKLIDYTTLPFFIKLPYKYSTRPNGGTTAKWVYDTDTFTFSICYPVADSSYTGINLAYKYGASLQEVWSYDAANPMQEKVQEYTFVLSATNRNTIDGILKNAPGDIPTELQTTFWIDGVTDEQYVYVCISQLGPEVSGTVVDTNAVTQALTGDNTVLIKYMSNAEATANAVPSPGTVVTGYSVSNNNETYRYKTYNFQKVESNRFEFSATDTRGDTNTAIVIAPMIEYIIPTANMSAGVITGDGELNIKAFGSYFIGDFGAAENELFVYYRYKKQGEDDTAFTDWIAFTDVRITEENQYYQALATITGLDYTATYVFQASVADALNTIRSADRVVISQPVFDWSATDFNFNVPVTIMGTLIGGDNQLLWSGNDVMAANGRAALAQPISAQMHGIVLVFSNTSGDVSWNTFYIPKEMVNLYNGGGHTCLMAVNAGLSTFGAKYLYITDEQIAGHATNQETGTSASGITFSNASYVLRYVFGV